MVSDNRKGWSLFGRKPAKTSDSAPTAQTKRSNNLALASIFAVAVVMVYILWPRPKMASSPSGSARLGEAPAKVEAASTPAIALRAETMPPTQPQAQPAPVPVDVRNPAPPPVASEVDRTPAAAPARLSHVVSNAVKAGGGRPVAAPGMGSAPISGACHQFASGVTFIHEPAVMLQPGLPAGVVAFTNRHSSPVLFSLSDVGRRHRLQSVALAPNASAKIRVPAGKYGVLLEAGKAWCSFDKGFSDGKRQGLKGQFSVKEEVTLQATLARAPSGGVVFDAKYLDDNATTSVTVVRRGGIEVTRAKDGGVFRTPGTVEGVPVEMVIDTGAGGFTISKRVADAAGLTGCEKKYWAITANGKVLGCLVTAKEITFGPFRVTNVEVGVAQNMGVDALLGNGVLKHFNTNVTGDRVRIVPLGSGDVAPGKERRNRPDPIPGVPYARVMR